MNCIRESENQRIRDDVTDPRAGLVKSVLVGGRWTVGLSYNQEPITAQ